MIYCREVGFNVDYSMSRGRRISSLKSSEIDDSMLNGVPRSKLTSQDCAYRTDDNGHAYMYYDNMSKMWCMMRNRTYERNGYTYKTDHLGNIISAEGNLHLTDESRKALNVKAESMTDGDQRGHIIADLFGGSNLRDNIIAMSGDLNQKQYKAMEAEFAEYIKKGKHVKIRVLLTYPMARSNRRPDRIIVEYAIEDGEMKQYEFSNDLNEK